MYVGMYACIVFVCLYACMCLRMRLYGWMYLSRLYVHMHEYTQPHRHMSDPHTQ